MTDDEIYQIIDRELRAPTLGLVSQFLEVHSIVEVDRKFVIRRVKSDEKQLVVRVFLPVKGEHFHYVLTIDLQSKVVVWADTESFARISLRASSQTLDEVQLAKLTCLAVVGGRRGNNSFIEIKAEDRPDEFESRLDDFIQHLQTDAEGVRRLSEQAEAWISVALFMHNGNTMLGGFILEDSTVAALADLNLAINFDLYAEGNLFL